MQGTDNSDGEWVKRGENCAVSPLRITPVARQPGAGIAAAGFLKQIVHLSM